MKVKVIKADVVSGTSQKTGEFYESTKVVVIFGDGQTGYQGYVPASFCWENGGYEVRKCHFLRGTGEAVARQLMLSLAEIYEEK